MGPAPTSIRANGQAEPSCLRSGRAVIILSGMKILPLLTLAVLALPRLAWGAPEPGSLTSKAKAAFADITKAKSALDSGKQKTSSNYLGKAETLLKSVLGKSASEEPAKTAPAGSSNPLEALAGKAG